MSNDPDANGGDSTHKGCTVNTTTYTNCATVDAATESKNTSTTNDQGQTTQSGFANTAAGGYDQWLVNATDANTNVTTYTYDPLGRSVSVTEPGETAGLTTQAMAYANWCAYSGGQGPCVEEDTTQRLNSTQTVTTRTFYDGLHRLVETRKPAPGGQDVVSYTFYDPSGHTAAQSISYFVAAYTGAAGSAAFSIPDSTIATSTMGYDGLGRTLSTTDAISDTTSLAYLVACGVVSGDSGCYEETQVTDANSHRRASFTNGLVLHLKGAT